MTKDIVQIRRALISVFDKSGLADLLKRLDPDKRGIELLSSGGTAKAISGMGYRVIEVSTYTGYPESPQGLVKTLHPKIHGGLLLDPENREHLEYMIAQGIPPIDIVINNLYPFQKKVADPKASLEDIRENIDIGGPAMIRAGAKNYGRVAVLINWTDAEAIRVDGDRAFTTFNDRKRLSEKAFGHTSEYDAAIREFLKSTPDEKMAEFYLGGK